MKLLAKGCWQVLFSMFIAVNSFATVPLKSIAHFSGLHENMLSGYGIVIGLAGSGDSLRTKSTTQSIANMLLRFGVKLLPRDIASRNVGSVILTSRLPAVSEPGDKLDVTVSSLGDAKSLVGGTLLMAPLEAADGQIYALAQGSLSVGGFKFDMFGNVIQKNHPTTAIIPGGAIVERGSKMNLLDKNKRLKVVLNHADFTTAYLVEKVINNKFNKNIAIAASSKVILINPPITKQYQLVHFLSKIENININPENAAIVVINERTGVIVAGGDIQISPVSISHSNILLSISTEYQVSQPALLYKPNANIRTVTTPLTNVSVSEDHASNINLKSGATVATLLKALARVKMSTRDIIAILETLKRQGALHAQLIIQ